MICSRVLLGKAVKQFLACSNIESETEHRARLAEAIGQGVEFTRCDWACLVRRFCGVYVGIEDDLVKRFLLLVDGHNRDRERQ